MVGFVSKVAGYHGVCFIGPNLSISCLKTLRFSSLLNKGFWAGADR